MIVTIDGPAGAGKSTIAWQLARELELPYLNSGYIYRASTLLILEKGGQFDDTGQVVGVLRSLDLRFETSSDTVRAFVGTREVTAELKSPEVTAEVYRIAGVGAYRDELVQLQRNFAEPDGVVTEGRDMGSVNFP
ncbi:MAG: (d)CMP kinase, partial [Planctomycetota bacterium]